MQNLFYEFQSPPNSLPHTVNILPYPAQVNLDLIFKFLNYIPILPFLNRNPFIYCIKFLPPFLYERIPSATSMIARLAGSSL